MSGGTPTASRTGSGKRNAYLWGAVLAVLAVLVGAVVWTQPFADGRDDMLVPTFTVEQGPLTISVSEAGSIEARDQIILASRVEGQNTIIHLVPEGTEVEAGDLLVEFDASQFEEQLVSQQISVQNAEANLIRARENLAVTESQGESDVDVAQLDYEFAQQDLANYIDGEYPKQVKEMESRIQLARSELKQAEDRLEWSARLLEEQYISQNEYESDQLAVDRRRLDVDLAMEDLNLLREFTRPRRLKELESDVEQKEAALERTKRRAAADMVQAEAELRARQLEYEKQKSRLAQIEDQIEKCRIVAPRSGMVVYATSASRSRRGNQEPLEAGQTVRERQELIYLPQSGAMRVEMKIHESSLEKVRVGQPVRVTVDALPNRTYTGRVVRIAPLPDQQSIWLNPDLTVYSTQVVLDDTAGELRTGMTCRAEIIVDQYDDAVYVPVQSVVRVGELPVVYVSTRDGVMAVPVEIGMDNNRMVRVLSGVEPGERVLLTPPLTPSRSTVERLAALQPEPRETVRASSVEGEGESAGGGQAMADARPAATPVEVEADAAEPAPTADRARGEAMTDEQRAERRRRFEQMTSEQRERLRQQRLNASQRADRE